MLKLDYFPQGVADGGAFLGREKEQKALVYNLNSGHHTLLMASRRFGKTSLARRVLQNTKMPFGEANFYLSQTEKSVEAKILSIVKDVISCVSSGKPESILSKIASYFAAAKKTWSFGIHGIAGVEFTPENSNDIPDNILTALNLLESILAEKAIKAVLFLDEIQELCNLENGVAIQGAIREFAQNTKHVTFIFSGSNRRLLKQMFDDRSMPLYELCERMKIELISEKSYKDYLNSVAKQTYNVKLADDVIHEILKLSQRHPKRVYNLCHSLWQHYQSKPFSVNDVKAMWLELINMRADDIRYRLKSLSHGQIKVITMLAENKVIHITGKEAQLKVGMSGPSIISALKLLDENDFVKLISGSYRVVDPLVAAVLVTYELHNIE